MSKDEHNDDTQERINQALESARFDLKMLYLDLQDAQHPLCTSTTTAASTSFQRAEQIRKDLVNLIELIQQNQPRNPTHHPDPNSQLPNQTTFFPTHPIALDD